MKQQVTAKGLLPGQRYGIQVRAVDGENASAWSPIVSILTEVDDSQPASVGGLTITPIFGDFVIKWNSVTSNFDGSPMLDFKDYVLTFQSGSTSVTRYTTATSFTYSLAQNTKDFTTAQASFSVYVSARDKFGNVGYSPALGFATNPAPTTPTSFAVVYINNGVKISWQDLETDITRFVVERATDAIFTTPVQVYSGPDKVYIDKPTDINAIWYYRVKAVDVFGQESAYASGNTPNTIPNAASAPTYISKLGTVSIFWDGKDFLGNPVGSDFDHVEVHLSQTSGFTPDSTTLRDNMKVGGITVLSGMPSLTQDQWYNTTHYCKLKVVNIGTTASTASAETAITVNKISGPDLVANSVTANQIAAGSITAEMLQVGVISKNYLSNPGFEDQPTTLDVNGHSSTGPGWTFVPGSSTLDPDYNGFFIQEFSARTGLGLAQFYSAASNSHIYMISDTFIRTPSSEFLTIGGYFWAPSASGNYVYMTLQSSPDGVTWGDYTYINPAYIIANGQSLASASDRTQALKYRDTFDLASFDSYIRCIVAVTDVAYPSSQINTDFDDAWCVDYGAGGVEITSAGIRLFNVDGEETIVLSGNGSGGNFFSVGDNVSITNEGVASFDQVNLNGVDLNNDGIIDGGVTIYGRDFADWLGDSPRGLIALGSKSIASDTSSTTSTEVAHLEVDAHLPGGRTYEISAFGSTLSSVTNNRIARIRLTTDGTTPDSTKTQLIANRQVGYASGQTAPHQMNVPYVVPAGAGVDIRLALTHQAETSGTVTFSSATSYIWIKDIGPIVPDTGIDRPTFNGTSKLYTTVWKPSWNATYYGPTSDVTPLSKRSDVAVWAGKILDPSDGKYHGGFISLLGFGGTSISGETGKTITSAINDSGVTIVSIKLHVNQRHGMTQTNSVGVGFHDKSSAPLTLNTTETANFDFDRQRFTPNAIGGYLIDITGLASFTQWKSGAVKGIMFGGPSLYSLLNAATFFGKDETAGFPTLQITYAKAVET